MESKIILDFQKYIVDMHHKIDDNTGRNKIGATKQRSPTMYKLTIFGGSTQFQIITDSEDNLVQFFKLHDQGDALSLVDRVGLTGEYEYKTRNEVLAKIKKLTNPKRPQR